MKQSLGMRVAGAILFGVLAGTTAFGAQSYTISGQRAVDATGFIGIDGRTANSLAGELYGDVMGSSITVQREFRRALPSIYSYSQTAHYQDRADVASEEAYASTDTAYSYVACPTSMCAPGKKWVMWDVPFSIRDTRKRGSGNLGYEESVSGFATGVSYMLGESSAIGLAVGYDYRKLDGRDDYHMRNRADTFHAALFGGTNVGCFFFDGYAGYSRSWNRSQRNVYGSNDVNDIISQVSGNYNDTIWSAGMKASYVWVLPNDFRITPSVGIDFSHVRFSGLTEKGGAAALRVRKNNYTTADIPLMVSLNKTFSTSFLRLGGDRSLWTPEVRGGYVPQIGAKRATTTNELVNIGGTPTFRAKSAKFTQGYGTVGTGVKIKIREKFIFAVDYDYSFASRYNNHSLTAMYGVSF